MSLNAACFFLGIISHNGDHGIYPREEKVVKTLRPGYLNRIVPSSQVIQRNCKNYIKTVADLFTKRMNHKLPITVSSLTSHGVERKHILALTGQSRCIYFSFTLICQFMNHMMALNNLPNDLDSSTLVLLRVVFSCTVPISE